MKKTLKNFKKLEKKTLKSRQYSSNLTKKQEEVLSLILNEYMNPKAISCRLQTSVQNIYQIISKIRKKGYLSTQNFNALKKSTHVKQKPRIWRYHGLHFVIKPYYFYPRYYKYKLDNGNYGIQYGDWVFKLHNKSIEVQSKSLVDFRHKDKFKAIKKAELSFNKALIQASNRFGFEIFKEGKANIILKRNDLAFGESDVAKSSNENYIRIKSEQGKTWFMIDKSKGFLEHEYTDEVLNDSEMLEPFFNDIRKGQWNDMKKVVYTMSTKYAENIEKHLSVLDKMSKTLDKINKKL